MFIRPSRSHRCVKTPVQNGAVRCQETAKRILLLKIYYFFLVTVSSSAVSILVKGIVGGDDPGAPPASAAAYAGIVPTRCSLGFGTLEKSLRIRVICAAPDVP